MSWRISPQYAASILPIRGEVWVIIHEDPYDGTFIGYWYPTKDEAERCLAFLNEAEKYKSPYLYVCPRCRYRRMHFYGEYGFCENCEKGGKVGVDRDMIGFYDYNKSIATGE